MYSLFSSCLLQCCPHGGILFVPILRPNRQYNDDEYEKYEPRPKIVIDKQDVGFEPTRSYQYEGYVGAESTKPRLRVAAQYSEQKKAIIVKVISVHCCDLFVDDVSQVRIYFGSSRAKQQTSVVRGEEPTFNQTFTFTNVEKAELLSTPIRFRICSRSGKSRMNLRAEGQLEGDKIGKDSPATSLVMLNKITTIKSEVPVRALKIISFVYIPSINIHSMVTVADSIPTFLEIIQGCDEDCYIMILCFSLLQQ
ncbi:C2 domain protein [Ancylostoma caninum]|uniref:C2 domain protein n=1 Tax=Ancylostoma caninum TaxID=29170 RepID=A0A368H1N6_ANCCA|nr:C2 domain protein [Ancylostoma caninum]